MLEFGEPLVDAHVHLTFATHGENPRPRGSSAIQELYLRQQFDAGVTLVRDCGALPGSVPPPSGEGLAEVISCGRLLAPDVPMYLHLREPVASEDVVAVAVAAVEAGQPWVKVVADAPGPDGNMLAAQPTYPLEVIAELCDVVHAAGGRVAAHTTGPAAPQIVDAGVDSIEHGGWLDEDAVARLGARGGAWTPTLSTVLLHMQPMIDAGHPAAPMIRQHLDDIARRLSGAVAAGVVVLAGTDELPHGSVRDEAELLHSYGLTETDAVAAASTAARAYLQG